MNQSFKSWFFVIIQAILLVGLLIFVQASTAPVAVIFIGDTIQLVGIIILILSVFDLRKSLTALPVPRANGQLQVDGLYRYVRHPMYVGVLVFSLGVAITRNTLLHYALFAALYALFYYKARYEEQLLLAKYPGYKTYMQRTPRFIPRIFR